MAMIVDILKNPWFVICFFSTIILAIGIVKKRFVLFLIPIVIVICRTIIIYIEKNLQSNDKCGLYSGHNEYRLGDMIKNEYRWKKGGESYHLENFPDSIASEYMRKTELQNNYDVLLDIVRSRTEKCKDLPSKQDIVVHLRVGDVVEDNRSSVIEILSSYTYLNNKIWSNYTAPLKHISNKVRKVDPNQVNKIVLVAGSHKDILTPKSCEYVNIIKKYFEDIGYKVELRLGRPPDSDFIYMCNARYFIPSTSGGYTDLIKNIVLRLNNIVL